MNSSNKILFDLVVYAQLHYRLWSTSCSFLGDQCGL